MSAATLLKPPPMWLIRLINPVMRRLLRTRAGSGIPVALLCFEGRRSGRRFEVPVSAHDTSEGQVVLTNARWAENFRGGRAVDMVREARSTPVWGTLVEDAAQAGRLVRSIVDAGTPARRFGIAIPAGHRLTDEEAIGLRTVLLLTPR